MNPFSISYFEPGISVFFIDNNKICTSELLKVRIEIAQGEDFTYYQVYNFEGETVYMESFRIFETIAGLLTDLQYNYENDL